MVALILLAAANLLLMRAVAGQAYTPVWHINVDVED
jgi:hypothetical protein